MIDVHCHLLPGIDDGAKSFDDSLLLLQKAEKAGVTDIILTPHYIPGSKYNADNVLKWKLFEELRTKAQAAGIAVRLYLGNEIYIDEDLPKMLGAYGSFGAIKDDVDADFRKVYEISTLNSKKYVLIELPVGTEDKSALSTMFSLVKRGFVPVIAHPERYVYAQDNPEYFDEFINMGCKLQGDYLALTGKYGKRAEKTLKRMLHAGQIFCLASDVHKTTDEYMLDVVEKKLLKIFRGDKAKVTELLVDNPRKILAGK